MLNLTSQATGEIVAVAEPLPAGWRLSASQDRARWSLVRTLGDGTDLVVTHTGRQGRPWQWTVEADGGEGAIGAGSNRPEGSLKAAHDAMADADAWASA